MEHIVTVRLPGQTCQLHAQHGARLYDLLAENGIQFDAPCGGRCFCGKCRAVILGADGAPIPGADAAEAAFFSADELKAGWRLICAIDVECDLTLELGEHGAQILAGTAEVDTVSPAVRARVIELPVPTLDDPRSDSARLRAALDVKLTLGQLKRLPYVLRESGFKPEAVWLGDELLYLGQPGQGVYGVAVDIGTTTMVAYLINLSSGATVDVASALNPQRVYGGDVISRSDYASQSEENLGQMQALVVNKLEGMICDMAARAGIDTGRIFHIVAVGNTTMMHLFCGLTTRNIAVSPFIPAVTDAVNVPARELGFSFEHARVTAGPCVAGYVGADTVACVLDCDMDKAEKLCLMVDIGTNGEIALWDGSDLYCCATAAGPAFEGAKISMGGIACEGAIDHVYTGPDNTISYTTVGGKAATHICGSGLIDAVAAMLSLGVIDETGYLADRYQIGTSGVFIEPQDIREVQLAKSAIRSGMDTLLCERSCSYDSLSHLYLAGGFGQYLAPQRAAAIGLIAPQLVQRCVPTGNSALAGAAMVLLDKGCQARCEAIARQAHICHLHNNTHFSRLFMENMLF